jgi:hypothetical protein
MSVWAVVGIVFFAASAAAIDNGLGVSPPMGCESVFLRFLYYYTMNSH